MISEQKWQLVPNCAQDPKLSITLMKTKKSLVVMDSKIKLMNTNSVRTNIKGPITLQAGNVTLEFKIKKLKNAMRIAINDRSSITNNVVTQSLLCPLTVGTVGQILSKKESQVINKFRAISKTNF